MILKTAVFSICTILLFCPAGLSADENRVAAIQGVAAGVAVSDGKAFLVDNTSFYVFNTDNPDAGRESTALPSFAFNVAISGQTAYVACGYSGLVVMDIGDSIPKIVGTVKTPDFATDVSVADGIAYVAHGGYFFKGGGLYAVDTGDPQNPRIVGSLGIGHNALAVEVSGSSAYIVAGNGGLLSVDISDPQNPAVAGSIDINGFSADVSLAGGMAYVANRDTGLLAIDIGDPCNLKQAGILPLPGTARVSAREKKACIAMEKSGVQTVDISDPANLRTIESHATEGPVASMALDNENIYVADEKLGLAILPLPDETVPGETPAPAASGGGSSCFVDVAKFF